MCTKVHDPALKADYELDSKNKEYEYEFEVLYSWICNKMGDVEKFLEVGGGLDFRGWNNKLSFEEWIYIFS